MKKRYLILGLFISFFLISCASGDDDDEGNINGGNSSQLEPDKPEPIEQVPDKPEPIEQVPDKPEPDNSAVVGKYVEMSSGSNLPIETTKDNLDINIVVIDGGGKISINPASKYIEKGMIRDKSNPKQFRVISNDKYNHLVFGFITDEASDKKKGWFFAQGNATKDMPTTGLFTYRGEAVIAKGNAILAPEIKTAKFTVNFKSKTIEGKLNTAAIIPTTIPINAQIKGHEFAGEANGIETKGGFYGPNAEEMSGVFTGQGRDKIKVSGAFGAIKK